jgi:tetratricopeptide (TPR) repeat protein
MAEPERPAGQIEIRADHGATAIGSVRNLNTANASGTAIGRVENLNIFLQAAAAQKAATSVLAVSSMAAHGPTFVGRREHLENLGLFLDSGIDGKFVSLVTGPAGVGKSALVREVAARSVADGKFTRALFADLRGYEYVAAERVQAAELYGPLLQGLGVPVDQIPEGAGERATFYHQLLGQRSAAGEPALLWFDNVADRGQVEELIPAGSVHRVVITSRETFPRNLNAYVVELDLLPIEEAVELLARGLQANDDDNRIDSDPDASVLLAELCDRLPLAIQIVAALLADEPARPVRDFAIELQEEEHRLDNLHYDDRLSVRAALALSYRRLSEGLQRLFRLMSQVPGGDVSLDAGRWLIDASASAVRPQLMALARSHLIQQHVSNRWSMHDLVRLFAAEMAATDPDDAERGLKSVVEHYRAGVTMAFEWLTAVASEVTRRVFATPAHAAAWFEAERATVISIVMQITGRDGYEEICLQFGVVLADLLKSQAHWRSDFYDVAAVTASIVPRVEGQLVAASALSNFGTALRFEGKYSEAQEIFERVVQMYEDLGDPDRASGARSNIGNLLQVQGRFDEAIAIYRQDLRQCPPATHPYPAANTLTSLGAALMQAGRPGEAVTQLAHAVKLCRELDDRSGLATALLNLGGAYVELSTTYRDPKYARKAVQALHESHGISRSQRNAKGQADAANNLGVALCSLRMFEPGIRFLREGLEYFESSGQEARAARTSWHLQQAERAAANLAR